MTGVLWLCLGLLACEEPAGTSAPEPGPVEPPDDEPVSLVWAREIHSRDGFGEGITPQPMEGGTVLAFLHNGDEVNRLFHLDTADGSVVDSFVVDAPGFGTGRLADEVGGTARAGETYVTFIDRWPFRLDLSDGAVEWLYRESLRPGTLTADGDEFFGTRFTDWDETPAVYQLDAVTGAAIDSFIFTNYPTGRKGGAEGLVVGLAPDDDSDRVVYFSNGYVTADSAGYARNWLQAMRWSDKSILWRRSLIEDASADDRTPILYDDLLIRPDADTIHAFDVRSGEKRWSYYGWTDSDTPPGGRHFLYANPVLSDDGLVYFGSSDEEYFCLEAATGREVWRAGERGANYGFQLIGDGMLAVAGSSGSATYLYDRHTGELLAELPKVSRNGWIWVGVHYDPATRRVYGYDGARAYCYRLNFEPPGE